MRSNWTDLNLWEKFGVDRKILNKSTHAGRAGGAVLNWSKMKIVKRQKIIFDEIQRVCIRNAKDDDDDDALNENAFNEIHK